MKDHREDRSTLPKYNKPDIASIWKYESAFRGHSKSMSTNLYLNSTFSEKNKRTGVRGSTIDILFEWSLTSLTF